jgi:hypothetical protein
VQPIGDEGDRAEQHPADDLPNHHEAAEPDHQPGAPLVVVMALAEEKMRVGWRVDVGHARVVHFR